MKLPAIQFYPGDWHKDQGVQALDLMQRGAWFELLLMMHDSDERGVLLINGKPMPEAVIARRLGLDNQTANQILTILLTYGVASRREFDGALFCRRMVKDENLRQVRTEAGKKGGNPALLNQTVNQTLTPSFSSSVTYSKEKVATEVALPATAIDKVVSKKPTIKLANDSKKDALVPTFAEVQTYAAEQHPNSTDAQAEAAAFHDHYASNGWRVSGKTPMVDWRAAFRSWMRRRSQFQAAGIQSNGLPSPARARTSPKPPDPNRWS